MQNNQPQNNQEIKKIIIIEDIEYIYSISKLENKDGISIILKELKHKKNIKFIYEALKDKLTNDIKQLLVCENIDEMINIIKDMIDTGNITVEKREDKYFLIINLYTFEKISKYEIELKKQEPIDEKNELLIKLNDMDNKFQLLQEEINKLKNKLILNKEDKKKIIKEIKDELNINEYIKEIIKSKDIKDILFKEFEERLSNIYIKKEDNKLNNNIDENLDKSISIILLHS